MKGGGGEEGLKKDWGKNFLKKKEGPSPIGERCCGNVPPSGKREGGRGRPDVKSTTPVCPGGGLHLNRKKEGKKKIKAASKEAKGRGGTIKLNAASGSFCSKGAREKKKSRNDYGKKKGGGNVHMKSTKQKKRGGKKKKKTPGRPLRMALATGLLGRRFITPLRRKKKKEKSKKRDPESKKKKKKKQRMVEPAGRLSWRSKLGGRGEPMSNR